MSGHVGPRVVPGVEELPNLPTRLNEGEDAVLRALLRLGPDWHVFVQPRVALAQPDFVAVHPDHGVVVIEVKDWSPELYRSQAATRHRHVEGFDGQRWGRRVSPIPQLLGYRDTFARRFFADEAGRVRDDVALEVRLALPRFSDEQAEELLGTFPTVTGSGLVGLHKELSRRTRPAQPLAFGALLRWLDEPEAVADQRLPLRLSREARSVAENPNGARVRRVRGPAGSGKSHALAARAVALAAQGKSVLVVSYNMTLLHYLHDLCARAARERGLRRWHYQVSFSHLDGLLRDLVKQTGERSPVEVEEWNGWALSTLERCYADGEAAPPIYDAVLVDEGQDFAADWWLFLRRHLCRPDGEMLLVADRTQNLYHQSNWTDTTVVGGGFSGPWTELKGTYRMPVDLVPVVREYAEQFLADVEVDLPTVETDHPALAEAHEPTRRRWVNVSDDELATAAADEVLALLAADTGLSPSDVVLLANHRIGLEIEQVLRDSGCDVTSVFAEPGSVEGRFRKRAFWAGTPGIKACTFHSFKGWESRAVVCVPPPGGEVALYIAMTRVKAAPSRPAYLTVVSAVDALSAFRRRFEREVLPAEVPALAGQRALDI